MEENQPIKLNIGCGNKFMIGYVNIDCVERADVPPDASYVRSDIRTLPFPDNYADEVIAIHVVEHFYRWEIEDVLKEWMRVLKPGGLLVIECPDILKAALYMVSAMQDGNMPPNKMTMWPLYGDPGHKDPLMCHKWGYTVPTLAHLMESVGCRMVSHRPAQFHMKEARDMRVEGIK